MTDHPRTELLIDHQGERWRARPGETITFGRSTACAVVLDRYHPDPTLHRLAGAFVFHGGGWIVQNSGSRWPLEVWSDDAVLDVPEHRDRALAPPAAPLDRRGEVVLVTARRTYRLVFDALGVAAPEPPTVCGGERTVDAVGAVVLSPAQRRLVLALVEPRLRDANAASWHVPSIAEVCARLMISRKAYERCLDALCTKLADAGVGGVRGDARQRAQYRRQVVAEWALEELQICAADLTELSRAS